MTFLNFRQIYHFRIAKFQSSKVLKKVKKVLLGKAEHYYVKVGVGLFSIENQEVTIGDKILISGPTTGNQEIIVEKMFVNGSENILAKVGDKVTMPLPFRIRLSDKLYKIIS